MSIRKRTMLMFALLVVTVALSGGCGRDQDDKIDFGKVRDSVYKNDYFGMSVELPPDWSVLDLETRHELLDQGTEMVAGEDRGLKSALKASKMRTVSLFTVLRHPLGTPVLHNQHIQCWAERVDHLPGIQSGKDYLFHTKRVAEMGHLTISFPGDMFVESIGGREFDAMQSEISLPGMTIVSNYYTTIMKGYALSFYISFSTEEEESSLTEILDTVSFEKSTTNGGGLSRRVGEFGEADQNTGLRQGNREDIELLFGILAVVLTATALIAVVVALIGVFKPPLLSKKPVLIFLYLVAVLVMFILGGAAIDINFSRGYYIIQAYGSMGSLLAFLFGLLILIVTCRRKKNQMDLSRPVGLFKRFTAFFIDFLLYLVIIAPPLVFLALTLEGIRTGEFSWFFSRHYPVYTDIIVGIAIVLALIAFFILFALPVSRKQQSLGQYFMGFGIVRKEGSLSLFKACLRFLMMYLTVALFFISGPMALLRKDKRMWGDLVFDTYPSKTKN